MRRRKRKVRDKAWFSLAWKVAVVLAPKEELKSRGYITRPSIAVPVLTIADGTQKEKRRESTKYVPSGGDLRWSQF